MFKKEMGVAGCRLTLWRTRRGMRLAALGPAYDYYDLEGWIASEDAGFRRTQPARSSSEVDNDRAAAWLTAHGRAHGLDGWLLRPGTQLVAFFMPEVMLAGPTEDWLAPANAAAALDAAAST